jgi:hypothetical protein
MMTRASTKQAEVLVDLTLPFLLGQLALKSSLPERSTRGVNGFESFGLGFCSKWKSECGVDFRVVDGTADAVEVDHFDAFCPYFCSQERS